MRSCFEDFVILKAFDKPLIQGWMRQISFCYDIVLGTVKLALSCAALLVVCLCKALRCIIEDSWIVWTSWVQEPLSLGRMYRTKWQHPSTFHWKTKPINNKAQEATNKTSILILDRRNLFGSIN